MQYHVSSSVDQLPTKHIYYRNGINLVDARIDLITMHEILDSGAIVCTSNK